MCGANITIGYLIGMYQMAYNSPINIRAEHGIYRVL